MEEIFDIEKFNIIEDEENYYFFRALNMADNNDLETGTILDEDGNIEKIRTDRERYEGETKYKEDSNLTLEEMFDHIKMHYRKDTNCISLSSNANVSISYGRGYYKDKYILVKVPKREMGEKVFTAGQYMLTEIKRQVEQTIQKIIEKSLSNEDVGDETTERLNEEDVGDETKEKLNEEDVGDKTKEKLNEDVENEAKEKVNIENETRSRLDEVKKDLEDVDKAKTSKELEELIKTRYTGKDIDINKTGIIYSDTIRTLKTPHSRIRNYQALSEEQNLEKNKIIAKLTILEQRKMIEPFMPNTVTNRTLIMTLGSAFSSSEIIHYGDIQKEDITELQPEIVDIFALLQQVEGKNQEIVSKIKKEILDFSLSGKQIEIPRESILRREDNIKDNITIEEMYEITDGVVEFGRASSIIKNLFYLSKSQTRAREFAGLIRKITGNNPEYDEILDYIEHNGFEIEPEIIVKQSDKGYKLSESLSLDVENNELVEQIKELSTEEQIEILENGGLSNVRDIITNNFAKVQKMKKIDKEEYYAEAIISLYDWEKIGIQEFTIAEKNNLVQRLKSEHCLELYKKLEAKGVNQNNIPRILLNIAKSKIDFEITENDTEETIKQKRLDQYDHLIENIDKLNDDELSIETIERFLGYYDIEGSDIQLKSYQKEAVDKVDEILEKRRYASVILPTGAGKSYVALAELLKHKDEKLLYLAPQNEILEQMKDLIMKYHGPKGTLGKTKDQIVAEVFPNLTFMTYSALLHKKGKETIKEEYGFIVLDELHRTGAEKWSKQIDTLLDNQSEETEVLGITATPRRDSDGIDMSNEIAEKLGYTNEEAVRGNHIAMNLSLVNAIRMGIVVNPKIINCEYNLKECGDLDKLGERIRNISDINEKNKKLEEYEILRRKIEHAKGIPEILQENVKSGGKYIVFLPVMGDIEDEDGNKVGKRKGKNKITDYEKQITEYFENSGIVPQFNSMLGEYGDKENQKQLEEFKNSEDTRFMLVMNKANEGLHIEGLNGIIWLRPLDENSRILYLQQLGRTIYSEDPNNPTKDEDRPVVIDLVNNTMNVNWQNEVTQKDDIQMMNLILDWSKIHGDNLPDINSSDKAESGYAKLLKEIQGKYGKYLSGEFEELNENQIKEIKTILELGKQIDLWGIDLPDKEKRKKEINGEKNTSNTYIGDFSITGLLRDFVDLEEKVEEIEGRTSIERFIATIKRLTEFGVDCSKMTYGDTIESLAKKSGISRKQIVSASLNPDDKIGYKKSNIAQAYRENATKAKKPTPEQVETLLTYGVSLNLLDRENSIDRFIEIIETLQGMGIDCSKMVSRDTIERLAKKSGISKKQLKEVGLNPDERIGQKKMCIAQAYRGTYGWAKPTKEQVERLSELGISLELKEGTIDRFIRTIETLQEIGVDCSKMTASDTIQSLAKKSGISREQIEAAGLIPGEKIGSKKNNIAQRYRGNTTKAAAKLTDEQAERLAQLGISLEKKQSGRRRSSKEIAQAAIDIIENENATTVYNDLLNQAGLVENENTQSIT